MASSFIIACLRPDPHSRPSAEYLLSHPWIHPVTKPIAQQNKVHSSPPSILSLSTDKENNTASPTDIPTPQLFSQSKQFQQPLKQALAEISLNMPENSKVSRESNNDNYINLMDSGADKSENDAGLNSSSQLKPIKVGSNRKVRFSPPVPTSSQKDLPSTSRDQKVTPNQEPQGFIQPNKVFPANNHSSQQSAGGLSSALRKVRIRGDSPLNRIYGERQLSPAPNLDDSSALIIQKRASPVGQFNPTQLQPSSSHKDLSPLPTHAIQITPFQSTQHLPPVILHASPSRSPTPPPPQPLVIYSNQQLPQQHPRPVITHPFSVSASSSVDKIRPYDQEATT